MPVADAARVSDAFFATKRVRALFPVPGVVSVVSQNENGPCPVLALVNALLLTRELDAERLTPDGEGGCGGASMDGIARAVTSVMTALRKSGTTTGVIDSLASWEERQEMVGKTHFDLLEQKYAWEG